MHSPLFVSVNLQKQPNYTPFTRIKQGKKAKIEFAAPATRW